MKATEIILADAQKKGVDGNKALQKLMMMPQKFICLHKMA
jgi:hypothetical protein